MNRLASMFAAWLLAGGVAMAADESGIPWKSLDAASQELLEGQKEHWEELPPARQRAMAEGAERWLAMSEE